MRWHVAALAVMSALLGGCAAGGGDEPLTTAGRTRAVALATPETSISPAVAGTASAVRAALSPAGFRLDPVGAPYRPSEPPGLAGVRRNVFRVGLSDPDVGHVVIYEFRDVPTAAAAGREFAAYLGSGFGQTNYPVDAQFALSQMGGTLVLGWWSPERSPMPQRVRRALELTRAFGQPIPVAK